MLFHLTSQYPILPFNNFLSCECPCVPFTRSCTSNNHILKTCLETVIPSKPVFFMQQPSLSCYQAILVLLLLISSAFHIFGHVTFFFFVFVFSTGLVRLYIAGLPLRSCRTIGAPSVQGSTQCAFTVLFENF